MLSFLEWVEENDIDLDALSEEEHFEIACQYADYKAICEAGEESNNE